MRLKLTAGLVCFAAIAFAAQPLLVKPGTYDPNHTGIIVSAWVPGTGVPNSAGDAANHGLVLQKNGPTATWAAAYVTMTGVEGLSTTNLKLGFDVKTQDGYCGAGSPRFNVTLTDDPGTTYFLGCVYGLHTNIDQDWTRVAFTGAEAFPPIPPGKKIASISLVADEQGSSILDNISVNEMTAGKPGNGPK